MTPLQCPRANQPKQNAFGVWDVWQISSKIQTETKGFEMGSTTLLQFSISYWANLRANIWLDHRKFKQKKGPLPLLLATNKIQEKQIETKKKPPKKSTEKKTNPLKSLWPTGTNLKFLIYKYKIGFEMNRGNCRPFDLSHSVVLLPFTVYHYMTDCIM